MSITKLKTIGNWAVPPANHNHVATTRPLTGRVIVGMLTGEAPPVPTNRADVVTSAKDRRRR